MIARPGAFVRVMLAIKGPATAAPGDVQMLRAVAAGDPSAFRELHRRFRNQIVRIAYGILLDASEAEDVAQGIFLRIREHAGRWRPDRPLAAWIHALTVNEALGARRRLLRFLRGPERSGGAAPDPERLVGAAQGVAIVAAALRELSPRQRAVAVLSLEAGLQPSEIASVVGISANAARVNLHRAFSLLREKLSAAGIDAALPPEEEDA
jgi:RNA polymerase sigma-70 factor (ECF subfamily)